MKEFQSVTTQLPQNILTWCQTWLASDGVALQRVEALRVEASNRHFYRLHLSDGVSRVLMCSPPELEDNGRFTTLAGVFAQQGIGVPRILQADADLGAFLLTDLGGTHLADVYHSDRQDSAVELAIDTLHRLAATPQTHFAAYDRQRLNMEVALFTEWFATALLDLSLDPQMFHHQTQRLIDTIELQPKCCVHRDYHSRNLLIHRQQLGVVDFQDALWGPALYDIASLLQDCYHEFTAAEVQRYLHYFVSTGRSSGRDLGGLSAAELQRSFDFTALQRQLKAIGIFARLHLRDHKDSHLRHITPNLERLLITAERYPELAGLHAQLNSCIEAARGNRALQP